MLHARLALSTYSRWPARDDIFSLQHRYISSDARRASAIRGMFPLPIQMRQSCIRTLTNSYSSHCTSSRTLNEGTNTCNRAHRRIISAPVYVRVVTGAIAYTSPKFSVFNICSSGLFDTEQSLLLLPLFPIIPLCTLFLKTVCISRSLHTATYPHVQWRASIAGNVIPQRVPLRQWHSMYTKYLIVCACAEPPA